MRSFKYAKKLETIKCTDKPQCRGMPSQVVIKLQVPEHIHNYWLVVDEKVIESKKMMVAH